MGDNVMDDIRSGVILIDMMVDIIGGVMGDNLIGDIRNNKHSFYLILL